MLKAIALLSPNFCGGGGHQSPKDFAKRVGNIKIAIQVADPETHPFTSLNLCDTLRGMAELITLREVDFDIYLSVNMGGILTARLMMLDRPKRDLEDDRIQGFMVSSPDVDGSNTTVQVGKEDAAE